ncbi:hypothetical protein F8C76_09520 [Flagellimonas olearia]|uniref:Uncharacterized protein n=1 Tax=Flagellimonas olearia TaxID=552546 RepID=A0A6I1DV65_9FLAO|nr:hypothetical protein [Allomuricauda olearia]KAB7528109.1 hypothetical protein F8C76_09520 [Allomuricauda olearia]
MEKIFNILKNFVDNIANWLEFIGFIITIITAVKVFVIDGKILDFKKKHLFQVRSKEHIEELEKILSKISKYISDFDNKKIELKNEIKKSEEIAKSIKKKLFKKDNSNTKALIKEAKKIEKLPDDIAKLSLFKKHYHKLLKSNEFNEEIVSDYYVKLSGLITSLTELRKDNAKSINV